MIVVLDTNVLFAALTSRTGLCTRLFELCIARHSVVLSEHILAELRRHLGGKARLTTEQIDFAIEAIANPTTRLVVPAVIVADACRDPEDLPVLGTAIAGGAAAIVTGDNDLLILGEFAGVKILSPRAFFDGYLNSAE